MGLNDEKSELKDISRSSTLDNEEKEAVEYRQIDRNATTVTTGELDAISPYLLTIRRCLHLFKTDVHSGLTDAEARALLEKYGPNTLGEGTKISYLSITLHQIGNAMIMVLMISMVIAFAIKDYISGGVIAFVVLLNAVVGFFQELKAEKTMGSLRTLSSPTARVIRGGVDETIPAEQVVLGDIVIIKVGDTVPADLRLVDSVNLETDEALLTGESLPIPKNHLKVYENVIPVGDRLNMAFSSSTVSKGRATGIAVKTGLDTEIGKISASLSAKKSRVRPVEQGDGDAPTAAAYVRAWAGTVKDFVGAFLGTTVGTPLHRRLSKLAVALFFIAVVLAIVVMASQKFRVNRDVAIYAICVALSMIPSSLVVVLTITMAIGSKEMAKRNVIVRKLDSLEALGAVSDICSDKTGTLTLGKMLMRNVWVAGCGSFDIENTAEPFNPTVGALSFSSKSPEAIYSSEELEYKPFDPAAVAAGSGLLADFLTAATLANVADVFQDNEGQWKAHGDPTEVAIQVFTTKMGYGRDRVVGEEDDPQFVHLAEFPFDSSIKRMSAVYEHIKSGDHLVLTKGAVERVLGCCSTWHDASRDADSSRDSALKPAPLDDAARAHIEAQMDVLSRRGLRVLAVASRKADSPEENWPLVDRRIVESNLTFLGLVGIYDPPRPESAPAVKSCHRAGINVHMLTGDHPGTAQAIAKECGIIPRNLNHYSKEVVDAMIMTAQQFDELPDADVDALPVLPLVIARCSPQTKVKMIEALHRRQKFCAMTGDGVNDSPSLKIADVGIAMGINGSDVAKDAADIVLSDDNFASILNAVEEGRRMSDNIQKFVLQLLACNVAQALFLMIGLSFVADDGYSVFPLSPVEVLWVIIATSTVPAMGLGIEKAAADVMQRPPKDPKHSLFTWEMLGDMVSFGTFMTIACLMGFVIIVYGHGDGELGQGCQESYNDSCDVIFRARSSSFATLTWCALLLSWEVLDMRRSFFKMNTELVENNWAIQFWKDIWGNQLLFWSILVGFVSVFPVVYIPVINYKVFLHKPIDFEWGVSIGFTIFFLITSEVYKAFKRLYFRNTGKVQNPEYELERADPFARYSSFSRANTAIV